MNFNIMRSLKGKVVGWTSAQGEKRKDRSPTWKLITGVAVSAVVFLMIAYFLYRAWNTGRKLAKALHERDVAVEERRRASVRRERELFEERIELREKEAKEAMLKSVALSKKVVAIEDELEIERETINAIKNWKDMDRYLLDRATSEPDVR